MTVGLLSLASTIPVTGLSQRSIVNIGPMTATFDYAFINHYLSGDSSTGPVSNDFNAGTVWPALIDANGWPNIVGGVGGVSFGGSFRIPDPANFSGPYVATWAGCGRLNFGTGTWAELNLVTPGTGTFTNGLASIGFTNSFSAGQQVVFSTSGTLPANFSLLTTYYVSATGLSGSAFQVSATNGGTPIVAGSAGSGTQTVNGTYVKNQNGRWTNSFDTITPYILLTLASGGGSGPQLISVVFQQTDPHSTGNYLNNFRFYRQADETDLLAGKVYRAPFKQQLVNLCPSAIRFMNWFGYAGATSCRFENRTLPGNAGYNTNIDWVSSPVYASGMSGTNQYTQAAATPTTANPKNTTASMTHGEIATCRATNSSVRNPTGTATLVGGSSGNLVSFSAITNANPGQVTSAAHGLSTGDLVVFEISTANGMQALARYAATITVVDANNFTIGIDTTNWGTYSPPSATGTISGTSLTLSGIVGTIAAGQLVYGAGVTAGTKITSLNGASGTVNNSQSIGPEAMTFSVDGYVPNFTLQVGSGNNRTAYPITNVDGDTPSAQFGNFTAGQYYTFSFDKNCAPVTNGNYGTATGSISGTILTLSGITGTIAIGQTVGGGTTAGGTKIVSGSGTSWVVNISQAVASTAMTFTGWVYGAWIASGSANNGMVPAEIITALVNELNAMSPAQPIGLWINLPYRGLNTLDPDYTSGSDYGLNTVSTILNGANGYAGLTAAAKLYVEYSNETWNFGGGFWASHYLWGRSYRRWAPSGQTDAIDMQLLLSTNITRSIQAANPGTRIKYILGGWGDQGVSGFGGNLNRINGSSTPGQAAYWYGIDPITSGWGSAPMTNYDAFAYATYLEASTTYENTTFATDSALYASGGSTNQNQAIANFVAAVQSGASTSCIDSWLNSSLTGVTLSFAQQVAAYGKTAINYEGGTGWPTAVGQTIGSTHTITSADSTFLIAVTNSSQWATAQVLQFNRAASISNTAMQAIYTFIGDGNNRWAYCFPDTYSGGVEGAALANSPVWAAMGTRNQALSP